MDQRRGCCPCGFQRCSRIIAYIIIILGLFLLTYRVFEMKVFLEEKAEAREFEESQRNLNQTESPDLIFTPVDDAVDLLLEDKHSRVLMLASWGWNVVTEIVGIIVAILLLVGSYKRKPRLLLAFIIYEIIATIVVLVSMTVSFFVSVEQEELYLAVIRAVVSTVVGMFSIWVVYRHKQEIESRKQERSNEQPLM